MTVPCTQGPSLDRMEKKFDRFDQKLDRIGEQLVSAAVLAESHRSLAEKVHDIDGRLKEVESSPRKAVGWALASAIAAIITLFFSHWGSQ